MDRKPVDGAKAARSGLGVEDLREDVARLSPDEFNDKHGGAFLLLSSAGFRRPKNVSSTEVHLLDVDAEVAERTAGVSVEIVPIRASQNSLTHLITVGRAANNDVAITDISVSRFHAFFKRSPSGGLQLHDAGSSNGTIVNGFSVCTKEAGPAKDVLAGDSIRFGQVDATYLDAAALRSFIEKFGD